MPRRNIQKESAAAVEKAGLRQRRRPVESQGKWNPMRGKLKEGPFRPGKTKHERRGR